MAAKLVLVASALVFCCAGQPADSEFFINGVSGSCLFGFELLMGKLEFLEEKLYELERYQRETHSNNLFTSCSKEPSKISGKYRLQPIANEKPFVGFCEQEKYDGGWLVIQHRFDGSVNFYRNWKEYRDGFGRLDGEFWIGLERLHRLTKDKSVTLMVEIEDYDGNYGYASYKDFEIGSESERYELKRLGVYQGTIGNGMRSNEGRIFTTRDSKNDGDDENCAESEQGAWWYSECGEA